MIEVDGKKYTRLPARGTYYFLPCMNCDAENDTHLCMELPPCVEKSAGSERKDFIFKEIA